MVVQWMHARKMPAELEVLESNFKGYRQGEWPRGFGVCTRSVEGEVTVVVLTTIELLSGAGRMHD